ncbi:MAG: type I-F CRISPR-associated protein Csy3, partial [Stenotrophomonas nitritireducens]|nr:type I-F CRISPR-associated protein Csy3 [Stenotrophomonas nitritireducens]
AEQVEVTVAHLRDGKPAQQWTFDALAHSLHELMAPAVETVALAKLGELIAVGLAGDNHVLLQVTAFVRMGAGQEVFPSQELILDKAASKKSKTLYHVDKVAAIHSQKIGNALRTVDTWYPEATGNGPIAVEPYGSVTTQGKAYRQPKERQDFYNLLDAWVLKDKEPSVEQQHFVIATLVRGGVFGEAG